MGRPAGAAFLLAKFVSRTEEKRVDGLCLCVVC